MRIMIIGGIGLALAGHYAAQGAQLTLCGRDPARLHGHPLATSAQVRLVGCDIADRAALADAIQSYGEQGLDMVIVTASLYADAAALEAQPDWDRVWCRRISSDWCRHSKRPRP